MKGKNMFENDTVTITTITTILTTVSTTVSTTTVSTTTVSTTMLTTMLNRFNAKSNHVIDIKTAPKSKIQSQINLP